MPNFANGEIYKLVNSVDDEIYIGSTCGTLHLRKCRHKKDANRQPNRRVYEHLNRVGWTNVRIILIESFPCSNKNELLRREQYHIDLLQPSLNKNSSYVYCPHGGPHNNCIQCGGASICEHNRRKSRCITCNGSQICEHNREKSKCIPCGGSYICEHGKQKSHCIPCGGASICLHNRIKSQCITCGGSSVCEHDKQKNQCKICNAGKYQCDYCNKSFGSNHILERHYTSMKHKLKFISEFEKVFNEVITMAEASEMGFQ
jgi:hypothetical protein